MSKHFGNHLKKIIKIQAFEKFNHPIQIRPRFMMYQKPVKIKG